MYEREIANAKQQFLARHNPHSSVDIALALAMARASQRNGLYHATITNKDKQKVKTVWAAYLRLIAARFVALRVRSDAVAEPFAWDRPDSRELPRLEAPHPNDAEIDVPRDAAVDHYIKLISGLRSTMNRDFSQYFCSTGFRISHSQKSISVFLKHLWCMGRIPMPFQCPVDYTILKRLPHERRPRAWTQIDDIELHKESISALSQLAHPKPLAVWELLSFQQDSSSTLPTDRARRRVPRRAIPRKPFRL